MVTRSHLRRAFKVTVLMALFISVQAVWGVNPSRKLVVNGKISYKIFVPASAGTVERYAATELQAYLLQITRSKIPIVDRIPASPCIAVGDNEATRKLVVPSRYFQDDGFRIRTMGQNLLIKGASPRGTLFGVYAFLERLGCWWFTPDIPALQPGTQFIPSIENLEIPALDVTEQPLMKYRTQDFDMGRRTHTAQTWLPIIEWMTKNRSNTLAMGVKVYEENREIIRPEVLRRGLRLEVGKHEVMTEFLSPQKYFAAHPEWFGMIKGVRTIRAENKPVVFETANPQAVAAFEANVLEYLKERPEIEVFQLWPPDGCVWSESPEAIAQGSPNERMALMVQRISKALKRQQLKTRVSFIAYSSYIEPPRNMTFDKNVIVEFCPINQNYSYPIDDPKTEQNAEYNRQLLAWTGRFPGEVSHYSYYAKYSWRSLPIALPQQIFHEMQYWNRVGEVGASIYSEPGNWLILEVNHLAFARAAWSGDLDSDKWFQSYMRARFSGAAEPMSRFYSAATRISLGGLISKDNGEAEVDFPALLRDARSAMATALELADTPASKALVRKLSWQPDYLDASLKFRRAVLEHRPKSEIDSLRRNLAALASLHTKDGTGLARAYGYQLRPEEDGAQP